MKDFSDIKTVAQIEWDMLQEGDNPLVLIGTATCGRSAGSLDILNLFSEKAKKNKMKCNIIEVGCIGLCYAEPIIAIKKKNGPYIFYGYIDEKNAGEIFEKEIIQGQPVKEHALGTFGKGKITGIPELFKTPVLKSQVRRVLKKCGFIDPININHYIAHDGYSGLSKSLEIKPEQIIEEIKGSGLRGRGGAGFPTWRKWQFCRNAKSTKKYVICNADEGDPGAFMNRSLLEGDPHALLEGITIAGYALGAQEGYIYCRAEYPLALERLKIAIKQAENYGLLGNNILKSGFDFKVKIKEGAGAFVCGEETALIASIEGERGMPRTRPPFPAVSGLWGKPTVINNVESLASVALIMQKGPKWFAQCGTKESKGTKTFALVGKINNSGLVEVPLGITLKDMIYEIGDGIPDNKKFKAVQTGGPSGGCIPASKISIRVDYDSLSRAGSIMGSGGMVVMDEDTCMVDVARYFLDFTRQESCGKCVPCRLGTKQMLDILNDIVEGKGKLKDIDLLMELGESIKTGSLCGLGQTAPNPVLTTIRYFRNEYEAHIKDKKCDSKVCKSLIHYLIVPDKCIGCHACAVSCPTDAIRGNAKEIHIIEQDKCIKCGMCLEKCPPKANAVLCNSGQYVPGGKKDE